MAKSKKWIAKATANAHGQFAAKARHAGKSTREFAREHAGDSDKTGKQARLAETLMGMNKTKAAAKPSRSERWYGNKD